MRRNRGYEPVIWLGSDDVRHSVSSCVFSPTTVPSQTLCSGEEEFEGGWIVEIEAVQSLDEGSLWRTLWDRSGQVVEFRYAAHGNAVPSLVSPHLVGTVRFGARPTFGGDSSLRASHTFSTKLFVVSGPTLVTS